MKARVTNAHVHKSHIGDKKGWSFCVYFEDRTYPNIVGALYTTKRKAQEALTNYLETGKIEFYGDAE